MTQRNEEWARARDGKHLAMEVIDESVRMQPDVQNIIDGTERHNAAMTMTYREAVDLLYRHGFRPIDLTTRQPIEGWRPPWKPAPARKQAATRAPETK